MIIVPKIYFSHNLYGNQNYNIFNNIDKVITAMIVLFVLFVVIQVIRKITFINGTAKTEGKVTEIRKYSMGRSGTGRNSTLLYPVVEFKINGLRTTFESSVGTSITKLKVGDTVKVRYNPDNYEEADIDSFFRNWYADIIMLGVNVFILIISCIILGTIF